MIQFKNIAKTFRKARVLDGISLDIGIGERVAEMHAIAGARYKRFPGRLR